MKLNTICIQLHKNNKKKLKKLNFGLMRLFRLKNFLKAYRFFEPFSSSGRWSAAAAAAAVGLVVVQQ